MADLGGFLIADFADHDFVGIVASRGWDAGRGREVSLLPFFAGLQAGICVMHPG